MYRHDNFKVVSLFVSLVSKSQMQYLEDSRLSTCNVQNKGKLKVKYHIGKKLHKYEVLYCSSNIIDIGIYFVAPPPPP